MHYWYHSSTDGSDWDLMTCECCSLQISYFVMQHECHLLTMFHINGRTSWCLICYLQIDHSHATLIVLLFHTHCGLIEVFTQSFNQKFLNPWEVVNVLFKWTLHHYWAKWEAVKDLLQCWRLFTVKHIVYLFLVVSICVHKCMCHELSQPEMMLDRLPGPSAHSWIPN